MLSYKYLLAGKVLEIIDERQTSRPGGARSPCCSGSARIAVRTIEPAIEYVQDIRCLAVRERIWAMVRRGLFWKANTETLSYELTAVPPLLEDDARRAMQHFGTEVLGLDFLQTPDGQ